MIREEIRSEKFPFSFVMRRPEKWDKKLPLVILLHGAGERGNGQDELSRVEVHGFSKIFTEDKNYECVLVQPQCEENSFWVAEIPYILQFIDNLCECYEIDESRIYLTGISMGGFGTWYTAMAAPDRFAAIAPVCGGGMAWNADVLTMPVWAFHGAEDKSVAVFHSDDMVARMRKHGLDVRYSRFDGVGHDVWKKTYDEELLNWFLQHKKK